MLFDFNKETFKKLPSPEHAHCEILHVLTAPDGVNVIRRRDNGEVFTEVIDSLVFNQNPLTRKLKFD